MTRWNNLLLPPGVDGQVVVSGLDFPTALDWDAQGNLFVGEVGFTPAGIQILRFPPTSSGQANGTVTRAQGTSLPLHGGTVTAQLLDLTVDALHGTLYYTTTGVLHAVNLSGGESRDVVAGLPAWGDHSTDEVVVGPEGRLYFTQGSATNSGVMGADEANATGAVDDVVRTRPDFHDVPCVDVRSSGVNYDTEDFRAGQPQVDAFEGAGSDARVVMLDSPGDLAAWQQKNPGAARALTGGFSPFGTPRVAGEIIPGDSRCNGALLSVKPDGSDLQVVAWGFRNPFAVKWHDGALWVSNNAYDNRGSRPVGATPDELWRISPPSPGGQPPWMGWPDFSAGLEIVNPFFHPLWGSSLAPLLEPPGTPPKPALFFSDHASANKFDFGPPGSPFAQDIFIAQFGTLNAELVRGAWTGMDVARANTTTGRVTEFIVSQDRWRGDFRPVEAKFGPDGRLYVVDFGPWTTAQDLSGNKGGGEAANANDTSPVTFRPGTGRILAFTLPADLAWSGHPEGNVGGDGTALWNGTVGRAEDLGGSEANGSARATISAVEYAFGGPGRDVRVGEPVVFVNRGVEGHTATEVDGLFNSGFSLAPGATFTWTPTHPGIYRYYCQPHPYMRGNVTVVAGPGGG